MAVLSASIRRKLQHFLLFVFAVISVFGCNQITPQNISNLSFQQLSVECKIVQHAMGESCIPLNPKRIVIIDRFNFDNALALGIKPVGTVRSQAYLVPYLRGKMNGIELITNIDGHPNLEKILLLKPDLIIGLSSPSYRSIYKQLSKIASTVLLPWGKEAYIWKHNLENLAGLLDKQEEANQVLHNYTHRVTELRQTLDSQSQQRSASFALFYPGGFSLYRKDSFSGNILTDVGLKTTDPGISELPLSEEILPEIDDDALFIGGLTEDDKFRLEQLQKKPLWFQIKAVKQNQVYLVNAAVWHGYNMLAAHAVLDDLEKYLLNR
ncbi:MAG: iron-siderophore ABC transporter substrate-binding protein [Nostoc sp. DedQUE04]|uniref:ABC transporter substrate-binding protein n=1 Tax=Nostoc sp. DedQUE04 TaxID=3075390 RepID=UPI002AD46C4C|nr:iron-siderophore ABC transporter substrate-binding protein [Nostoc sp. DedQUE04]MDZ8136591.1 iron-siderophore ABC transporter substrate-binding protein [Nostoc sp. DedQUE04]